MPFLGSAAVRLALGAACRRLARTPDAAIALALLEPGSSWSIDEPATTLARDERRLRARGREGGGRAGWTWPTSSRSSRRSTASPRSRSWPPSDRRVVLAAARRRSTRRCRCAPARFDDAVGRRDGACSRGAGARPALERLSAAGSLLAAAEAIGAAERILDEACRYAGERRQFGRTIGSFQALRHILADMYVRAASGWSAVLYAAAAFDEGADEAAQTASIAKAYVSRGAREVAHGAMQVFGGIAFTAEHPAHRFLRRIVVREQQFGDAAHHERALGRALAERAPVASLSALAEASADDAPRSPTRPRSASSRSRPAPSRRSSGRTSRTVLHDERWRACEVALISGGKSNLTYRVASDAGEVVLRRPPLGHVLPTAHDMVREYRVQAALERTAVPVPRMLYLGGRRRRARSELLRDGAGARAHLPQPASARLRRHAPSSARRSAAR